MASWWSRRWDQAWLAPVALGAIAFGVLAIAACSGSEDTVATGPRDEEAPATMERSVTTEAVDVTTTAPPTTAAPTTTVPPPTAPPTTVPPAPPPPPPPPPPPTTAPPLPQSCTAGYDPCIPPGSDVDCAGGSGNGPRYVQGPVYVSGPDVYDLDRDGNGVGCQG